MEYNDNQCPESDESDFINLSFRMVAPISGNSRYDDNPEHTEDDSEWPEFEDRIYADDFAFFIYSVLPDEQKPFLFKVDNFSVLDDPHTTFSGGPSNYTLKVSIPKDVFESVYSTDTDDIILRIVAFANTNNKNNKILSNLSESEYSTFNNLINATSKKLFYYLNGTIYLGTGGTPSIDSRIPMYGVSTLTTTREVLFKSRPYNPVYGDNIYMLRSVAQIKVVDNISTHDDNNLPRIETVTFHSSTNQAYVLPYDAVNYKNGKQIETSNVKDGAPMEWTLLKKENQWIGYIPEQEINSDIPYLTITLTYEVDADGRPLTQKTFTVPMHGYKDQNFNFGDAILRNHIYTLSVIENGAEAEVSVEVREWASVELTLDYTETVTISPKLTWTSGTYDSYNPSTGVVVVKAAEAGSPVPLKATFGLQTPIGATWTAQLIPMDTGNPYAFQLWNGIGPVQSLTGIIDPDKTVEIGIVALNTEPEVTSMAHLQIVVTLGNGNVIEADVTPNTTEYKNFTIVQNRL